VRNRETLLSCAEALPNGKMLQHAPLGLVICGDTELSPPPSPGYLIQDCSAALENILLALEQAHES
jgi:hypothetical protein